jgi:hypothetical protein
LKKLAIRTGILPEKNLYRILSLSLKSWPRQFFLELLEMNTLAFSCYSAMNTLYQEAGNSFKTHGQARRLRPHLEELAVMLLGHDEFVDVLLPLGLVGLQGRCHAEGDGGGPSVRLLLLKNVLSAIISQVSMGRTQC